MEKDQRAKVIEKKSLKRTEQKMGRSIRIFNALIEK